ncbi:MAG: hypothetical protein EOP33_02220 [Rickettsiaceae bacterium]|nr:MAG: hypothetical protein EOP33_02220 [Rickettsiaceae bacterium]
MRILRINLLISSLIFISCGYHHFSLGSYDLVSQKIVELSTKQTEEFKDKAIKKQKYQYIYNVVMPIKNYSIDCRFNQQVCLTNLNLYNLNTTWQKKIINISKTDLSNSKRWQPIHATAEKLHDPWKYHNKVFHHTNNYIIDLIENIRFDRKKHKREY